MKNSTINYSIAPTHPFYNWLGSDEKILWVGQPSPLHSTTIFEKNYFKISITILMAIICILSILTLQDGTAIPPFFKIFLALPSYLIFFFGIFVAMELEMYFRKKHIKYAITSQHILLSTWTPWFSDVHKIAFDEVDKIIFSKKNNNVSTFFINLKKQNTDIVTFNFIDGEKREQVTLELIENGEEVKILLEEMMNQNIGK